MQVSIVVPLFNSEHTIERALRSIVAQRFTDFEVIVVDDGSTDGSVARAQGVRDPRIRIVLSRNRGPGSARNLGVEHARGEVLAFLDSDDEWLPSYLEHALFTLESSGTEIGVVGYERSPNGASTEAAWRRRGLVDGVFQVTTATPPELFITLIAYMSPWNTVVRRELFTRWGGFCDWPGVRYAEDAYLWLKLALNSPIAVSLAPPCAIYHTEDSTLTRQDRGPRPVEPFLTDPATIFAACPPGLTPLLRKVLTRRALKTACMLGYWGRWREARELTGRFGLHPGRDSRYFLPGLLAGTPLAAPAGWLLRTLRSGTVPRET